MRWGSIHKFMLVLMIPLLLFGCEPRGQAAENQAKTVTSGVSHSWAYEFVHWNGISYRVTDIQVPQMEREVGRVESLITEEYIVGQGVYSNRFSEGTKLYSIPGIDSDDAIAVEVNGGYYKMINTVKERAEQKNRQ
ncbi:hypothetical protein GRF59_00670 [Paenibacillus sp. HJL G12]|uniref:Lipoprotein n=1 Tax=Paenibacillus dendrobii TaxID=2691084 RepID=A0A7X3IDZ1_9BACL|nr:hypothetical protein [Paenibacillus dendrobii]MWV42130.1 hypothetical protein [Paenibacillus dendrobii]